MPWELLELKFHQQVELGAFLLVRRDSRRLPNRGRQPASHDDKRRSSEGGSQVRLCRSWAGRCGVDLQLHSCDVNAGPKGGRLGETMRETWLGDDITFVNADWASGWIEFLRWNKDGEEGSGRCWTETTRLGVLTHPAVAASLSE